MLAAVESLLDKSLIRRLPGDEQTAEFSMLESLREYAAEQLASHAEAEETRARHAATTRPWLRSSRLPSGCRRSEPGCCGQAATTRTCAPHWTTAWARGGMRWALWLAAALGWYHYTHGDLGHGQALVDAVLLLAAGR